MTRHTLHAGTIHVGDWMQADLTPGYTLAIVDGPYGMSKAAWDRMGIDGLADWYVPHLVRVSSLLASAASLYVWNTTPGLKRLDPVIRGMGWTWRADIIWDKGNPASMLGWRDMRTWPDQTEVCGFYQRDFEVEAVEPLALEMERRRRAAGLARATIDRELGTSNVSQYWWQARNWQLPNRRHWATLQKLAPSQFSDSWDEWSAREQDARERSRPPFGLTECMGNVWRFAPTAMGEERLWSAELAPDRLRGTLQRVGLHPCQKPLLFAERMIRASTRPGERVLVPFGGTCREAVVCEWMARTNPAEARGYDVCELNADGVDYIGPVLAQIRGEDVRPKAAGQVSLFGSSLAPPTAPR